MADERDYKKEAEALEVYLYIADEEPFEPHKGMLFAKDDREVVELYESISPCKCGEKKVKVIELDSMGDFYFFIECPRCKRRIGRSMYDNDVNKPEEWIYLCIRDWNNGIERKTKDLFDEIHIAELAKARACYDLGEYEDFEDALDEIGAKYRLDNDDVTSQ